MKRIMILALLITSIAVMAGCGNKDSRILAKVNGEVITVRDFNGRIDKLPKQYQDIVKSQKKNYLDDLIMEKLLYKKALTENVDKDKDTQDIIAEATKKIIIARLVEKEVEKKVRVSDEEVKKYYDEHSEEFMMPERWRASHILVDTADEANAIKQNLAQGASFEEIAKEKSKDPTATSGGDIGYFSKGQLVPEFEEECFRLKTGEVGNVVKTQFGYHIIKLTDKKNPEVQPFDSVKDMVKRELERSKKKDLLDKMMSDAKGSAKIVINEKVLDEEIKKDSPAAKPAENAAEKAPEKAPEKK
ncbi:MAG: peptidylprolyl isomerase [Candidatus Omnitrophota bacterium]|nr:peptidylprolyl isomerase [Candidatus Omnitrophota bacterium]